MAADLHIHALVRADKEDLREFHRGKYDSPAWGRITNTPNIWIGEVSWLKAMLFEDNESFIPGPVQAIANLIGTNLVVLTPLLKIKILEALDIPVQEKAEDYRITEQAPVEKWLEENMGERLFTVSW